MIGSGRRICVYRRPGSPPWWAIYCPLGHGYVRGAYGWPAAMLIAQRHAFIAHHPQEFAPVDVKRGKVSR
jgi:hypothetical protein